MTPWWSILGPAIGVVVALFLNEMFSARRRYRETLEQWKRSVLLDTYAEWSAHMKEAFNCYMFTKDNPNRTKLDVLDVKLRAFGGKLPELCKAVWQAWPPNLTEEDSADIAATISVPDWECPPFDNAMDAVSNEVVRQLDIQKLQPK